MFSWTKSGGRVKSISIWWRRRPAEEQLWPEQSEHVSHIKDKLSAGHNSVRNSNCPNYNRQLDILFVLFCQLWPRARRGERRWRRPELCITNWFDSIFLNQRWSQRTGFGLQRSEGVFINTDRATDRILIWMTNEQKNVHFDTFEICTDSNMRPKRALQLMEAQLLIKCFSICFSRYVFFFFSASRYVNCWVHECTVHRYIEISTSTFIRYLLSFI